MMELAMYETGEMLKQTRLVREKIVGFRTTPGCSSPLPGF